MITDQHTLQPELSLPLASHAWVRQAGMSRRSATLPTVPLLNREDSGIRGTLLQHGYAE